MSEKTLRKKLFPLDTENSISVPDITLTKVILSMVTGIKSYYFDPIKLFCLKSFLIFSL